MCDKYNFMEEYKKLLEKGMANVSASEQCKRFGILGVEGHIQGGRTILSNFQQIATCLRRKPEHLAKFLFKELATSGQVAGDRLILTSKKSSKTINDKIKKYVDKYGLCKKCGKPDTELGEENGDGFIRCLACGARAVVH